MAATDEQTSETTESDAADQPGIGLLFELEHVAVRGRAVLYEVVKGALADRDVELTPALFARHCLSGGPASWAAELLEAVGKQRSSTEKFADDIAQGMRLSLSDGSVQLDPGFEKALRKAAKDGFVLGALTGLDDETAAALIERLGLKDLNVAVYAYDASPAQSPGSDAWRKLAKLVRVVPTMSIVLASSRRACRAALLGGMRCIVVTDPYTDFQDFSGADVVVDSMESSLIDTVSEMILV